MKSAIGLFLTTLMLTGCTMMVWDKPGTTQQEFARDNFECQRDSQKVSGHYSGITGYGSGSVDQYTDLDMYQLCMQGKGYTRIRQREAQSTEPPPPRPMGRPSITGTEGMPNLQQRVEQPQPQQQ